MLRFQALPNTRPIGIPNRINHIGIDLTMHFSLLSLSACSTIRHTKGALSEFRNLFGHFLWAR